MALLSNEQSQTRFLAIVLPLLTLCTHTLLALSSILPGSDPDRAVFVLVYNVLAIGASILGLVGALRLLPSFVSIYSVVHATTLSFATIALVNTPFDFVVINPIIPSWDLDQNAICRDINTSLGWNDGLLLKCSTNFGTVKSSVACFGLILMVAQWWALMTVRRWGKEIRFQRFIQVNDVEKSGILREDDITNHAREKTGLY